MVKGSLLDLAASSKVSTIQLRDFQGDSLPQLVYPSSQTSPGGKFQSDFLAPAEGGKGGYIGESS